MPENTYHAAPSAVAEPPPGCPVHETWTPLSDEYLKDPYPIARQLSNAHPVFFAQALGHLIVTRMEDISEIFRDSDTFASTNVQDPIYPVAPEAAAVLADPAFNPVAVMSNRPEPDHARIRKYTRAGFSRRRIKTLEPFIETRLDGLITAMIDSGSPAEMTQAVSFPVPGETVFQFLGFPEEDYAQLKDWCGDRMTFSWGNPTAAEQTAIAKKMLAYWKYCQEFVAERAANRGDDFSSELLDAHDADNTDLSYREVESIIYGISFAGHEPVTNLINNSLLCLLPRRHQWDEICADPSLIPHAIEEVLRFESSQISWRRITTRDTEIGGVQVPAGTRIMMNFASANRQPDIFENPDEFDIHRPNAAHHMSFGKGIHHCLGSSIAKTEAIMAITALSQRLPALRLVDGQVFDHAPNITFRGPVELHVEWDT